MVCKVIFWASTLSGNSLKLRNQLQFKCSTLVTKGGDMQHNEESEKAIIFFWGYNTRATYC
jgi:hypothetical protein